ncbi:MAG: PAS domain-containing protein [Bacteroidia bacterium]
MIKNPINELIKILLLEPDQTLADEIISIIQVTGLDAEFSIAQNKNQFKHAIKVFKPEIILSEYLSTNIVASEIYHQLLESHKKIPFIIIAGAENELQAIELVKAGIDDYVLKNNLNRLPVAVIKAIEKHKTEEDKENAFHKMKASEDRMRSIFNNEPECIKIVNLNGELLDMNEAGLKMIEADSVGNLKGQKTIEMIHPDDKTRYGKFQQQASRGHRDKLQFRMITTKGKVKTMFSQAIPLRDEEGAVYNVMYVSKDITDILRAEEELKKSEERFNIVMQAMDDIIIDWDMVNDQIWCNDNFYSVFGFDPKNARLSFDLWKKNVHPEDINRVLASFKKCVEEGTRLWIEEYRYIGTGNREFKIYDRGILIYDENQKPVRMICSMINMTKTLRSDPYQSKNEEFFRMISENAPDSVLVTNAEGVINFQNNSFQKLCGYTPGETAGKNFKNFIRDKDLPAFKEEIVKLTHVQGYTSVFKFSVRRKNGDLIKVESSCRSLMSKENTVMLIFNIRSMTNRPAKIELIVKDVKAV